MSPRRKQPEKPNVPRPLRPSVSPEPRRKKRPMRPRAHSRTAIPVVAARGEFDDVIKKGLAQPETPVTQVKARRTPTPAGRVPLTRLTRKGLFAGISERSRGSFAGSRDAESTADVRALRQINLDKGQPEGPEWEPDSLLWPDAYRGHDTPPVSGIELAVQEHQRAKLEAERVKLEAGRDAQDQTLDDIVKHGPSDSIAPGITSHPLRVEDSEYDVARFTDPDSGHKVGQSSKAPQDLWTDQRRRAGDRVAAELVAKSQRARAWQKLVQPTGVVDGDWELLRLVMVEALTVAEAAKRMEIRPETAKKRLQRLRARLKRR